MSTVEYLAEKKVSVQEEISSLQRTNEKSRDFSSKSFALAEQEKFTESTFPETITNRIFRQRGFIAFENWTGSFYISSKVINVQKEFVQCECIISKESKILQVREFPILLFNHIFPLQSGTLVKIKISQKPGSTRTDIIDGKGLGIEKDFEIFNIWDQLKDFENKRFE